MRCAITVVVAMVLLAGSGCSDAHKVFTPGFADESIAWGEPVNGLRAGLARREYEPGREPRGMTAKTQYYALTVRNVSKGVIKFMWPGETPFGSPRFPLAGDESVRAAAVFVPAGAGAKEAYAEVRPTYKPAIAPLEPGEERVFEFRLAPKRFGIETLAGGRFYAVYSNRQERIDYGEGNGGVSTGVWVGEVRTGEIKAE